MTDIFDQFNAIEWRTWETLYALDRLHAHWLENESLIERAADVEELINKPNWEPNTPEEMAEYSAEVRTARHLHDEIMIPNFRYSTLVMVCSLFERELLRLKNNVEKSNDKAPITSKELRGGPTAQILRYLEAFHSIDLKANASYLKITEIQKVRDCIVHCLGDAELSRDKNFLLQYSVKRNDIDINLGSQIKIEALFILDAFQTFWLFFLDAFQACGWKINDTWKYKNWTSQPRPPNQLP